MNIVANPFVLRQTEDSPYSHADVPWDVIIERTEKAFFHFKNGYRDGVVLVPIDPSNCWTTTVQLKEGDRIEYEFKSRRKGEAPRKIRVSVKKQRAASVEIVLYMSSVLAEDGDNVLPPVEGNWEIVSLNAHTTTEAPPIQPHVLMHNHFGSDGGTATNMSPEEFEEALRESFLYWKDKA